VLRDGRELLSNIVASQIEMHQRYGGVFPEMASRQHMVTITPVIREALADAGVGWADLDAVAAIHGPGLAGSLLVGLNTAKAVALAHGLPLVGVNHMEGHVYANWLIPSPEQALTFAPPTFPLVCLIVSGGHSELILMRDHHDYQLLGRTIDDAAGEAFDKVARLLGLGYPGGPAIQRAAEQGNPAAFSLPKPILNGPFDFSFSGLKTAVLRLVQELRQAQGETVDTRGQKLADAAVVAGQGALPINDIAASFQAAIVEALVLKTTEAATRYGATEILLAGGVAANRPLREAMQRRAPVPVRYPPIRFCTDNAAMVAMAGHYRYLAGMRSTLDLDVLPSLRLV
jgi:N6-L-threonylcarbamoyladenine synthase